jgi:hypothetical protein
MKKTKLRWVIVFPFFTLLSMIPARADVICPPGLCWDTTAEWCAMCDAGGGGPHSETTALVNPPNSSVNFAVDGNQCTNLKLKNLNLLGVLASVTVKPAIENQWNVTLPPFTSQSKDYCRLVSVPVSWGWDISTSSDAANIAITATWAGW